jgi:stage V sporulation protein AC
MEDFFMDKIEYAKLVSRLTPKEDKLKDALKAFLTGGIVGIISVIFYQIMLMFNMDVTSATGYTILILILISSLFTGMGFFDEWVSKYKCGLIIPITGFAHSVTASSLDYKKDGLITGLGANIFKLAGSVILYGVISAFILVMVKVVFFYG